MTDIVERLRSYGPHHHDVRLHFEAAAAIEALQAERDALREDAERLDWLERNPRIGEMHFDDGTVTDAHYYAVAGASGVPLRAIIDAARKEQT